MKVFSLISAGLVGANPVDPETYPELAGDVRYTCESAAYWRKLGLAVPDKDVYGDCTR
jgi:hypothetical protein